jgi:hypothetical protein
LDNAYYAARSFATDFGKTEYALKRSGFLRKEKDVAEPDWNAFASALGNEFFASVTESKIATTLIGEPPRRLLSTMEWSPEKPVPLTNVHELIVQGLCRVRNSYIHGEKFTGGPDHQWDRDLMLVSEAHAVLRAAIAWLHLLDE